MGFGRKESAFTPLEDNVYTMYASEATIRHSRTGKIGVNLRLKVNDLDESGNPQKNAGRTIFVTYWMDDASENLIGMYCQFLDALGFKVDDAGEYVLPDGSKMPDLLARDNGEYTWKPNDVIPFLVGIPFVTKTKHSINEYTKDDGTTSQNDQYRLGFVYENKVVKLSCHSPKTDLYQAPAAPQGPTGAEGNGANPFGQGW